MELRSLAPSDCASHYIAVKVPTFWSKLVVKPAVLVTDFDFHKAIAKCYRIRSAVEESCCTALNPTRTRLTGLSATNMAGQFVIAILIYRFHHFELRLAKLSFKFRIIVHVYVRPKEFQDDQRKECCEKNEWHGYVSIADRCMLEVCFGYLKVCMTLGIT